MNADKSVAGRKGLSTRANEVGNKARRRSFLAVSAGGVVSSATRATAACAMCGQAHPGDWLVRCNRSRAVERAAGNQGRT